MAIKVTKLGLEGVLLIEPQVFGDSRGFFLETYHSQKYAEAGLERVFVQDNLSRSCKGVVRGLHYQLKHPQGKLVTAIRGEIFDVAVDIRPSSATFGKWVGVRLSEDNHKQIFVPEGFAHGFCVLSESADVLYKCTDWYTPGDDYGILWNDEQIAIDWPIHKEEAIVSDKDIKNPRLADADKSCLPQ